MKHRIRHIHFVGIGGAGMSGIAEVLLNLGYEVSGSDRARNGATQRLAGLGARIWEGHAAHQVEGADVVVSSTAVSADNPELVAARLARIPVIPRASMLAELMRLRKGIAVAGTHGKTTTTSLVACILEEAGLDPTYVIGGKLNSAGTHAALGTGEFMVVEADESDRSFLLLHPIMAVVTNIDRDHMESYGHDFQHLQEAFLEFLDHLPFYGLAVLCVEDPIVASLVPRITKPVRTYGFGEAAQIRAVDLRREGGQMCFGVEWRDREHRLERCLEIRLNLPGRHNVLNALAAMGIAQEIGVPYPAMVRALNGFTGVGRRFQRYGDWILPQGGHITLVDDYGHHPVEMAATLEAARGAFPARRLVLVFQPHRYTRTRDCFTGFVDVLASLDRVFLLPVYGAGEAPIPGADSQALALVLRQRGIAVTCLDEGQVGLETLREEWRAGDVWLTMGAGNIGHLPQQLVEGLQKVVR
ncbi:MAG: UDP-N-acetylmuramate--L-alanine ligase [Betaproteobacteria bacterium]|nr:UDP-N-acetylmuramate--L-alanine ligase [Betaproteobacteria bacterium]